MIDKKKTMLKKFEARGWMFFMNLKLAEKQTICSRRIIFLNDFGL